jgi:hypothetical protein
VNIIKRKQWISVRDRFKVSYYLRVHDPVYTGSTQMIFIIQTMCPQQQYGSPVVSLTRYNGVAKN